MDTSDIIGVIRNFDFDALRAGLADAPDPACGRSKAEVIESSVEWLEALQSDLVALVSQVEGSEDIDMVLAIQYVEMKSRWIAFNTKMNYTMFKGEQPDVSDMCRASAVSSLLAHLESLLRQEDIDHITEFLARPISEAA